MSFITRSQILEFKRGYSTLNENVATIQASSTAHSPKTATTTIFLSHSHKDRDLIEPALAFLRSHGVTIYVDWQDGEMPETISAETAKKIKVKIKEHQKFIVMVTENSKESRWVPWELGFADPVKSMDHIAILPIAEKYDFAKNEYMRIYPKIELVNNSWYIWNDDPLSFKPLDQWLKSK